jgi:hypothetical protein
MGAPGRIGGADGLVPVSSGAGSALATVLPRVQALRAAAKDWVDVQLHGEISITMNLSESVQIFL